MQATIIISVVAFSSGSIAAIAIYLGSAPAGIVCAFVLMVIVYLALRPLIPTEVPPPIPRQATDSLSLPPSWFV